MMQAVWAERNPQWGMRIVMVATVLLLVLSGCGQYPGASQHPAPQTIALSWQQGNISTAIADQYVRTDWHALPVAPSASNILYGCAIPAAKQSGSTPTTQASLAPEIWVTRDRAAHWEQVGTLPITRPNMSLCYLTVDTLNAATVIAVVAWPPAGNHPTPGQWASFVSFTGGQTWLPLTFTWAFQITHLATTNSATYAMVESVYPSAPHLVASTDGMHTWHPIDQAISTAGKQVLGFVAYAGTRTILAQVGQPGIPTRQLWLTQDGGMTWRVDPSPTVEQIAISEGDTPAAGAICAGYYDSAQAAHTPNQLFCSTDGGAHWSERSGLNLRASIAVGPATAGEVGPVQVVAVAVDGAVLALDKGSPTPQFYRLPAGSSQWQPLGGLPLAERMVVFYYPHPATGLLWAFSIGAGSAMPDAQVYTARYP